MYNIIYHDTRMIFATADQLSHQFSERRTLRVKKILDKEIKQNQSTLSKLGNVHSVRNVIKKTPFFIGSESNFVSAEATSAETD